MHLAERILKEAGKKEKERIAWVFRQALSRPPTEAEQDVLGKLYEKHRKEYGMDKNRPRNCWRWARPCSRRLDPAELAAWTSVARAILNLHEAITRN